jgi:tRNA modification GTPase
MDLAQAEAVLDVIHAQTERELAAARAQLSGELGRRVEAIRGRLLEAVALTEAFLDFPEEDLGDEDVLGLQQSLVEVEGLLSELKSTEVVGRFLRGGLRIVLAGAPNAGKSSLLNALCGHERALVHEEAGTTRDFLEATVVWDGWRIVLVDTAGLRETGHPVERAGVNRTLELAREADLVLAVQAPDAPLPGLDGLEEARLLRVWNKVDLATLPCPAGCLAVSAVQRTGLDALRTAIVQRIAESAGRGLEAGCAVSARHALALGEALTGVRSARTRLASTGSDVVVAQELRLALSAVGQVTGRVDVEDVLDVLFSRFCIGK